MNTSPVSVEAAWHVVHTKPRQEFRALEQLQNQRYTCFLPTLQVQRHRAGRVEIRLEPLFARYLFIHLEPLTCNWTAVRNTRGVSSLVAFGKRYATLADSWIEEMLHREEHVHSMDGFSLIERASVTGGVFPGLESIYRAPTAKARSMLLMEWMSRSQESSGATVVPYRTTHMERQEMACNDDDRQP